MPRVSVIGAPIVCTQNATLGEEFRRGWHPERFSKAANAEKDVLVVGAGPAGMECAMVLGKRGLSAVHLLDEQDAIGGCIRAISAYPHLGEWGRLVTYRQIQLDKLAERRGHYRDAPRRRGACSTTARRSSCSPPARAGARTA